MHIPGGHCFLIQQHNASFRKMMRSGVVCMKNMIKNNHRIIGRVVVVFPGNRNRTFFSASSSNSQLLDIFNPTEVGVFRNGGGGWLYNDVAGKYRKRIKYRTSITITPCSYLCKYVALRHQLAARFLSSPHLVFLCS